jgi:hypothetical protein
MGHSNNYDFRKFKVNLSQPISIRKKEQLSNEILKALPTQIIICLPFSDMQFHRFQPFHLEKYNYLVNYFIYLFILLPFSNSSRKLSMAHLRALTEKLFSLKGNSVM